MDLFHYNILSKMKVGSCFLFTKGYEFVLSVDLPPTTLTPSFYVSEGGPYCSPILGWLDPGNSPRE